MGDRCRDRSDRLRFGGGVFNSGGININLNIDADHLHSVRHAWAAAGGWDLGDIGPLISSITPLLFGIDIVTTVWMVVSLVIGGAVSLGYAQFNLDAMDGGELRIETLFSAFPRLGTGVAMRLLTGLFILLWSLLLVIPGVIAAYRYAMTPYILAENPDLGVIDAINTSKEMMRGNKFRLFCLRFSFIGWHLLTLLTLGILSLWVHPYMEVANAAFYREVSGSWRKNSSAAGGNTALPNDWDDHTGWDAED